MSALRKLWVLAALLGLAAAGCMQVEQETTINPDNSADLKIHYAMSEGAVAQIEAMKQMAAKDPNFKMQASGPSLAFDEASIRAGLEKDKKDGVEVKSVKTETRDGWKHVYLEVHCADLATATKTGQASSGSGFSLTKNADGNYLLELVSKDRPGGQDDKVPSAEEQQMAKAMMAGLKVSIKVRVPGDIIETTAPVKDARTAAWTLDISDEKFFEKSAEFGKKGMKVVFKGEGLNLKEFKAPPPPAKAPAPVPAPAPEE